MTKVRTRTRQKKYRILCPSKGRADRVTLTKILRPTDFSLIVPMNEVEEYEKHNRLTEAIGTPPRIRGIAATRQWILDTVNKECHVLMLDDDIVTCQKLYMSKGEETQIKDPEVVIAFIESTIDIAEQMGSRCFGFTSAHSPLMYVAHRVLETNKMLNGACMGFLKGFPYRYDTSFKTADDYFITCLTIFHDRFVFVDGRITFKTKDNSSLAGGCQAIRTSENMMSDTLKLRGYFGSVIVPKLATNIRKNVHLGERSIYIPFF